MGSDIGDVAALLREDRGEGPGLLEAGVDALQSVRAAIRQRERQGDKPLPAVMDTERMTDEERAEYTDRWRQHWLSFPPPRAGDFLLLEIAYPSSLRERRPDRQSKES